MPKVLFDNTHSNGALIDSTEGDGLSLFAEELKKNGFEVESIEEQFLLSLKNADILVIPFPQEYFTNEQIISIVNFVKDGKGLLLMAEYGNFNNNAEFLNDISKNFKTMFNKDCIADFVNVYKETVEFKGVPFTSQKIPQFVKINGFVLHPITDGIKEIMHYACCSLDTEYAISFSQMTSFADINVDGKKSMYEPKGNFPTASAIKIEGGRVVCLGDTSLVSNKFINKVDNKKFGVNVVKWLAKKI